MARKPASKTPNEAPPDPERQLWLTLHQGPAVLVNRMAVNTLLGGGFRLSFAEQYDNNAESIFRSAVVMSDWNAYQLMLLLQRLDAVQGWMKWQKDQDEAAANAIEIPT